MGSHGFLLGGLVFLMYLRLQFEMLVWESLRSFIYKKTWGPGAFFEVD